MKIRKIEVHNFKAISNQEVDFNGCSAIVTAANDTGKTSLLRGLMDRFRSEKPDIIVKEGKEKGYNKIILTDGSIIEWKFTKKSETFSYTTKEGIKQTTGVISTIGERYFGEKFDIDAFLDSGPKAQEKELQKIVGLDFREIDDRYAEAYGDRTEANRKVKDLLAQDIEKPEPVEEPNLDAIKAEIEKAEKANAIHKKQLALADDMENMADIISDMIDDTKFEGLFDFEAAHEYIKDLRTAENQIIDTDPLEERLEKAREQQRDYDRYEVRKATYEKWITDGKKARKEAKEADKRVKDIEAEKAEMIENADMPKEFEFGENGLLYKGLPLTENQISKSGRYIAALKLGAMMVGEVRTLHFDASALDNNNLAEVQKWAESNDFQLLIERPDYEGGEIKYEIIKK